MNRDQAASRARRSEAGFTLVEALVAIVVLIFGLMAVTNLLLVAASSNTVANQGTAAVTASTQAMDFLKATSFDVLDNTPGGTTFDAFDGGKLCNDVSLVPTDWHCTTSTPGVGTVHTGRRRPGGGPLARRVHHLPLVHQLRPGDGRLPGHPMRPKMQRERGFSMVELIVAMTVTLIVSSAIYGLSARPWTSSRATSTRGERRSTPSRRPSRASTRPGRARARSTAAARWGRWVRPRPRRAAATPRRPTCSRW